MLTYLRNFESSEQGQDLIEYTLLLAFVVLASAALFIAAGGSIETIWGYSSTTLGCAVSASNPS